jgi:Uma2 family endonuclease
VIVQLVDMTLAVLDKVKREVPTLDELWERLGRIPLSRILLSPPPGQATEEDLLDLLESKRSICELVDGTLVEKPMGTYESAVAAIILFFIQSYLEDNDIGFVTAGDGPYRLKKGLVRLPDVSFVSWKKVPDRDLRLKRVLAAMPDLAVEVLSESNTAKEIERKLKEFFKHGCSIAWVIHPFEQIAFVHTSPKRPKKIGLRGTLDGGSVLPGFKLPMKKIFDRAGKYVPHEE